MRINGPGTPGRVGGPAQRGRAGEGFSVAGSGPARGAPAAGQSAALASVDAVFALQEVEDTLSGPRRRAVRRGHEMLDLLDDVRLALLTGRIAHDKLERLARLSAERTETDDPRLSALVADIELRARVELAKLGRFPG